MDTHEQLREELEASDMRYRRLFESARDGILVLDALSRKIIDANPSMVGLLGGTREEVLGKELREIGLFKTEEESETAFRELIETGSLHCEKLPLETMAGKLCEVEFTANLYSEGLRQVIQCSVRDTTGRKRAEDEREQLARNAERLAYIAGKAARLGGWTIHLPDRTLVWSDENCAIHEVPPGYKPTLKEGIGYFLPEHREQVIGYVEACLKDGTAYDFELPKYTAKGRLIWVRSIGEPMRDEDGAIVGIQGAFQDITARKQVEAEREKMIKELQNALAEVKTLREFLPICSYCKKIRGDENYWSQIENYITENTHTKFSHGICPDCYEIEVSPQLEQMKLKKPSDTI